MTVNLIKLMPCRSEFGHLFPPLNMDNQIKCIYVICGDVMGWTPKNIRSLKIKSFLIQ